LENTWYKNRYDDIWLYVVEVILLPFISATASWGGSEKLMVEIRPYSPTSFQRNIAYLKISYITAFDTINQPTTDLVPSGMHRGPWLGRWCQFWRWGTSCARSGWDIFGMRYLNLICIACCVSFLIGAVQCWVWNFEFKNKRIMRPWLHKFEIFSPMIQSQQVS